MEMLSCRLRRFAWRAHVAFSRRFLPALKGNKGGACLIRQTHDDGVQQLD